MIAHTPYRGVVVPMTSPFTADGTIDDVAAAKLSDRLATEDIGIFVLGTTGETSSIRYAERLRLVEAAVRGSAGRVAVYAGIGDNCLSHSVEAAEAYLGAGAQAVVAHLPCYYPLTPEEMHGYFERLHNEISGDLMVYNIPQTTHMSIPLQVVEQLSSLPRIVGFKDSERLPGRAEETVRRCGGQSDFALFMGAAVLSVAALRLGFDGLVPSSGNFVPNLWSQLLAAARREDWPTAESLQTHLDAINQVFQRDRTLGQSIAALKAGLSLQDICSPHVLPPLRPASAAEQESIRERLDALGALA